MSLVDKQSEFLLDVARLIIFAHEKGYQLTGGELNRAKEMQEIYFKDGRSKTMDSKHLKRLAIDLNLFIDGKYKTDKESFKEISIYWKSLHPNNTCGYYWGWDFNHFQRS